MFDRPVPEGLLSGYKFTSRSGEEVQISHLLFVDDTLVLCKHSKKQLANLSLLLLWFEVVSRLINLDKSSLILVGDLEELALELDNKTEVLPTTYLGLPLGAPRETISVWDGVEERFRKRVALWKRWYISKEGRLTLMQSTLPNMSIYIMSLSCMPKKVKTKTGENSKRFFVWGRQFRKESSCGEVRHWLLK